MLPSENIARASVAILPARAAPGRALGDDSPLPNDSSSAKGGHWPRRKTKARSSSIPIPVIRGPPDRVQASLAGGIPLTPSPQFLVDAALASRVAARKLVRMDDLLHRELSEDIIGAAIKVLNTLKPGLDEKLYENALLIELTRRNHTIEQQKSFSVFYEGHFIGKATPDLIVDSTIIVDPKVVSVFNETHVAQMTGYLALTGLQLALLVNFKNARLAWKRVVRTDPDRPPNN
jgi:GxxExxY protein